MERTQKDDWNEDELDGDELEEVEFVEAEEAGADRAAEEGDDHEHEVGEPLELPAPRPRRPSRRRYVRLWRGEIPIINASAFRSVKRQFSSRGHHIFHHRIVNQMQFTPQLIVSAQFEPEVNFLVPRVCRFERKLTP